MSTKTMKEKATELLQRCEVVVLASVNKEGYPRPVPMSKIATEGISTIWMSTGADSLKTIDFRKNPKAGLCFQDKGDSVALTGTVEVVTDEKMKKELFLMTLLVKVNVQLTTGLFSENLPKSWVVLSNLMSAFVCANAKLTPITNKVIKKSTFFIFPSF